MTWWLILMNWLVFQGVLGTMQPGQTVDSPGMGITWADGRRFAVIFRVTRIGGPD